jgi:hypothetical protein
MVARATASHAGAWEEKTANEFNAVDISVRAAITVFPGESYQVPRSRAERR